MINRRSILVLLAALVAVLQIGFLFSMITGRAAILRSGTEVVLEVRPIDPRDLLRGDYVVLGYNITSVPVSLFSEPPTGEDRRREKTVFVRLAPGEDGIWQAVAARYGEPPAAQLGQGEVDIKGTTRGSWRLDGRTIDVNYGIERFYVPEGEGRAIEQGLGERVFRMIVAVGGDGTAQIKSFHDGDTLLYAEPYY